MKTKREDVLIFLACSILIGAEQFNKGFELFRNSENKNPTLERTLNKTGFSDSTLSTVLYELQKIHGITDSEIRKAKKAAVPSLNPIREAFMKLDEGMRASALVLFKFVKEFGFPNENTPEVIGDYMNMLSDNLGKIEMEQVDFDRDDFESEFANEIESIDYPVEIAEGIVFLREPQTKEIKVNEPTVLNNPSEETKEKVIEAFKAAPDDVKQEIRFRDEFPFINDPNLPAELKQLVTDKFSHYHAFAAAHTSLSNGIATEGENAEKIALSNDQVFSLAKVAVENFQMDQLIREEFVYYKEHNKVLGVHPIFKQRKLQEVVNLMTTAELSKRAPLLENYIRRDKGKSEAAKDEMNKAKFAQKVLDWQFELALVNVRLGISAAK